MARHPGDCPLWVFWLLWLIALVVLAVVPVDLAALVVLVVLVVLGSLVALAALVVLTWLGCRRTEGPAPVLGGSGRPGRSDPAPTGRPSSASRHQRPALRSSSDARTLELDVGISIRRRGRPGRRRERSGPDDDPWSADRLQADGRNRAATGASGGDTVSGRTRRPRWLPFVVGPGRGLAFGPAFAVHRCLGCGPVRSPPVEPLPTPPSTATPVAFRMPSMMSAFFVRVLVFTDSACAIAWSSSRSLPSNTERSSCCSAVIGLLVSNSSLADGLNHTPGKKGWGVRDPG